MRIILLLLAIVAVAITSTAQDYQDYADGYEQDNLYQDYAAKQQEKVDGGGGNGLGKAIGAFGISYFIGAKVHSNRVTKKMKTKHLKDQKALYSQYYNDVYKLEEQKAEQQAVIEQYQAALA
mmetsp:Transcript_19345/g.33190  ORF Transcript_19345/g.33190 Transcript_19345/m.33190 type:complete len:122 (-) Transcript_19345:228-593(-)|eukprot:CAMPEP_0183724674 /NCGR_PEP_ID=MMETSP0737-20130205/18123_1 /TAXON_ID=385413 /ORGANISM="Thalassiosira miniscula, Strain CCMP1093" /LENGTH=121 /DNA_ID=CAMNT_0025955321 /DNA_START=124 /DNA_END=489 /DNA_ORIENTATION=-